MTKKKVKMMDAEFKNHSVSEAKEKVNEIFKAVEAFGKDKVDVKISFYTKVEAK